MLVSITKYKGHTVSFLARLNWLKGQVLDFFFPPYCLGCQKEGDFLCSSCRNLFPRLIPPLCPQCGRPLPPEGRCRQCEKWKLEIDAIRSPYRYEGVVRQAIHCLKYYNWKVIALPLAQLLAEHLKTNPMPATVIAPVPLHPRRLRERGYNQSGLIARELSRLMDLPLAENLLFRVRDNPPQAKVITAEARRSNVVGAFCCRSSLRQQESVLLIDDVCTTGATLNSCASALKAAGAGWVRGLTVAREV
jgi:ComF family protein